MGVDFLGVFGYGVVIPLPKLNPLPSLNVIFYGIKLFDEIYNIKKFKPFKWAPNRA